MAKKRKKSSSPAEGPPPKRRATGSKVMPRTQPMKSELDEEEMERELEVTQLRAQVQKLKLEKQLAEEKAARELDKERYERKLEEERAARALDNERAARKFAEAQLAHHTGQEIAIKQENESVASDEPERTPAQQKAFERRQRRFPWLKLPSKRWKELPEALLGHILTFLNDKKLFELRVLNSKCYHAYYNQMVCKNKHKPHWFHQYRAVKLAGMGRIFPRVIDLFYGQLRCDPNDPLQHEMMPSLSSADLSAISPQNFPSLRKLFLYHLALLKNASLSRLPPNKNLRSLGVDFPGNTNDLEHITPDRFPNLERIIIYAPGGLTKIPPHDMLKKITLPRMDLGAWNLITKRRFPKLREVGIKTSNVRGGLDRLEPVRHRLLTEGVTLNILP